MIKNQYDELLTKIGFTRFASIETAAITFDPSLRDLCLANSCGKSGTNWSCPPACGDYESLREGIMSFEKGLVLQKVYSLEDSFDIEGMEAAADDFHDRNDQLRQAMEERLKETPFKLLGAGGCNLCETCTYPDQVCRFPEKTLISIEACCINAYELCNAAGIPYINGKNTVSYLALLLVP